MSADQVRAALEWFRLHCEILGGREKAEAALAALSAPPEVDVARITEILDLPEPADQRIGRIRVALVTDRLFGPPDAAPPPSALATETELLTEQDVGFLPEKSRAAYLALRETLAARDAELAKVREIIAGWEKYDADLKSLFPERIQGQPLSDLIAGLRAEIACYREGVEDAASEARAQLAAAETKITDAVRDHEAFKTRVAETIDSYMQAAQDEQNARKDAERRIAEAVAEVRAALTSMPKEEWLEGKAEGPVVRVFWALEGTLQAVERILTPPGATDELTTKS